VGFTLRTVSSIFRIILQHDDIIVFAGSHDQPQSVCSANNVEVVGCSNITEGEKIADCRSGWPFCVPAVRVGSWESGVGSWESGRIDDAARERENGAKLYILPRIRINI
jgi:hypothetical protein